MGWVMSNPLTANAGVADPLPVQAFVAAHALEAPAANAAFTPGEGALPAPAFAGVQLEFFTVGDVLVPVQRGEMVRETRAGATPGYWRIIPQFGRVWRKKDDGDWARAAFPGLMVQFIQQSGPYLIKQYFVAWG
jgi:hypothetical protein